MRCKLSEIALVSAGQGAPQGDSNYCESGTPFVKAGNLQELSNGASIDAIQKVSNEVAATHGLKLQRKGSVLFAKSGMSCLKGYVYVLPEDAYIVSHLACVTPMGVDSDYLCYYFRFHRPNKLVKDAAYPSISLADIGCLEIEIPEGNEVTQIVDALKRVESIINLHCQQLTALDTLIKARFVELFGDSKVNPYGFNKVRLKDSCEIVTGNTPSRTVDDYYGDYIEWIKTDNIMAEMMYPTRATESLSEVGLKVGRYVEKGAILMACIAGSVASIGKVCITDRQVAFNQQINAIVPKKYNALFLYVLLQTSKDYLVEELNMALKGILSKSKLGEKTFILPPMDQQNDFAAFVAQIDKSKAVVQKALDEAQTLFDSLMQQYFG